MVAFLGECFLHITKIMTAISVTSIIKATAVTTTTYTHVIVRVEVSSLAVAVGMSQ